MFNLQIPYYFGGLKFFALALQCWRHGIYVLQVKKKKTFILINEGDVGMTIVNWSKKRWNKS